MGVGADIAIGSQNIKGNWAPLVKAPTTQKTRKDPPKNKAQKPPHKDT